MQKTHTELPLKILSAVYGKADVTHKARNQISQGCLSVKADNEIFGDSWYGNLKALVVVYQYGDYKPEVTIAEEGRTLTINPQSYKYHEWCPPHQGQFAILGAAYGLANVTDAVTAKVHGNSLKIAADNNQLGDGWPGIRKVLTVTYLNTQGTPTTATVEETRLLEINIEKQHQAQIQTNQGGDHPLVILSAVYGKADVTPKVRSKVSQGCLSVKADNDIFGDSWYGYQKALVVVYQYGKYKPEVVAVEEGETLTITPQNYKYQPWHLAPQGTLAIVGAAYGLADVTDVVTAKLHNNYLKVAADNNQLGDGWPGVRKVLTVTFLNTQGIPTTATVEETGLLEITMENQHQYQHQHEHHHHPQHQAQHQTNQEWDHHHLNILGAVYGKADVTSKVRSQVSQNSVSVKASNDVFGDPWIGNLKSLVIVYQYGEHSPEVAIANEGSTITITPQNYKFQPWQLAPQGTLTVLGAAYGLANVTNAITAKVHGKSLKIATNNDQLGDGWYGVRKILSVIYLNAEGIPETDIMEETGQLEIDIEEKLHNQDRPHLKILSAVYGKKSVVDQVRSQISKDTFTVIANNNNFGDSWPGVPKSLFVVYQYDHFKPEVAIVQEGNTMKINHNSYNYQEWHTPHQGQFAILGAAYGLENVTEAVNSKVHGHFLELRADNNTLGDRWPGIRKTFVVAAINSQGVPVTVIREEDEHLKLDLHA